MQINVYKIIYIFCVCGTQRNHTSKIAIIVEKKASLENQEKKLAYLTENPGYASESHVALKFFACTLAQVIII